MSALNLIDSLFSEENVNWSYRTIYDEHQTLLEENPELMKAKKKTYIKLFILNKRQETVIREPRKGFNLKLNSISVSSNQCTDFSEVFKDKRTIFFNQHSELWNSIEET